MIIFESCKRNNCDNTDREFSSGAEAKLFITSRSYKIEDSITISNSKMMASANFYSCDGKTGYFSFTTESGSQFFCNGIPIKSWIEFKESNTKENYHEETIQKISTPAIKVTIIVK